MTEMACACGRGVGETASLCFRATALAAGLRRAKETGGNCFNDITPKPETPGPAGLAHKLSVKEATVVPKQLAWNTNFLET